MAGPFDTQSRTERCPYCGQPISRQQLLDIRTKVRQEISKEAQAELARRRLELESEFGDRLKQELTKKQKELELETTQLRKSLTEERAALDKESRVLRNRAGSLEQKERDLEATIEKRRQKLDTEFEARLTRELKAREKSLQANILRTRKELGDQRKAFDDERRLFEKRVAAADKQQRDAQADLERRTRKFEDEATRRAEELAKRQSAKLEIDIQRERTDFERERLVWQRKQGALEKEVGDLKRRVEEQTPFARQEYSEEALLQELRAAFREDGIQRLERGRRSGDLRQAVILRGEEVGSIIYEVKNVKTWLNSFVEQAKGYRTIHNTQFVVIVSNVLPGKAKSLAEKDGILIVAPEHAVLVARLLRDGLLRMAKARLSSVEREEKVAQLYAFLTSDDYKQRAEEVVDGVKKLRELQASEQETHRRTWEKQEQQHKRIHVGIDEIRSRVDAIIESESPRPVIRIERRQKRPLLSEELTSA